MVAGDNDGDLHSRLTSAEKDLAAILPKVTALQDWRTMNDIAAARREVEWLGMTARLDKIDSNVSRVFWLFFSALILAGAAFVINGGLKQLPEVRARLNAITGAHASNVSGSENPILLHDLNDPHHLVSG